MTQSELAAKTGIRPKPIKGIKTGKVRDRRVLVYIMHEERAIGISSAFYIQTCMEGYYNFSFDRTLLVDAYLKARKINHERE